MFLYITIPLTLIWLLIGYVFNLGSNTIAAISGPAYFLIAYFGIGGFKSLYPVAIGLGSTRTQFLKVFYGVGILGVILSVFFLNILQFVLKTLFLHWDVTANILHPGVLLVNQYQFFTYFWIDLMLGLFLVGASFFMYSINFRLGMRKSLIVLMLLSFIGMTLYYGGFLKNSIEWFLGLDIDVLRKILINLFGLCGIGALLLTYPIMRNASLKPKSMKE